MTGHSVGVGDPTAARRVTPQTLFADVVAALEAAGDRALADRISEAWTKSRSEVPAFLFVGEPGQGKTSLINALLDGAGVATAAAAIPVPVHLRYGERPAGHSHRADGSVRRISYDLRLDADAHGDPEAVGSVTTSLELQLPHDLLRSATLIDTPSVGGLRGNAVTLPDTDVLVLVASSQAPLSAPELRFLAESVAGLENVIFVLSKTDLHPDWTTIARANEELLRTHAPRLASKPMIATSAYLRSAATAARDRGDDSTAELLEAESGIATLRDVIVRHAASASDVRTANRLRMLSDAVAVTRTPLQNALDQSKQPSEAVRQRETVLQEQLGALQRFKPRWSRVIFDLFGDAERDLLWQVEQMDRENRARVEQAIVAEKMSEASLQVMIETRVAESAARLSAAWADAFSAAKRSVEEHGVRLTSSLMDIEVPAGQRLPGPTGGSSASDGQALSTITMGYLGFGMGSTALGAVLGLAGVALPPLGVAGGALVGGAMIIMRRGQARRQQEKGDLRARAGRMLDLARSYMSMSVRRAVAASRGAVMDEVQDALASSEARVAAEIKELRALAQSDDSERRAARRDAELRMQHLDRLSHDCDRLLELIRARIE